MTVGETPSTEKWDPPPHERRESFYAIRFLRWMFDSGTAAELGSSATTLAASIVALEDQIRYERPVAFYNHLLQQRCGLSLDAFNTARAKLVASKLLGYRAGRKGVPGTYWTTWTDCPDGRAASVSGEMLSAFPPVSTRLSFRNSDRKQRESHDLSSLPPKPLPPSPNGNPPNFGGQFEDQNRWEAAVGGVGDFGVKTARTVVDRCRTAGIPIEQVERVIEHWRKHSAAFDGPGALVFAFEHLRADGPVEDAFPATKRRSVITSGPDDVRAECAVLLKLDDAELARMIAEEFPLGSALRTLWDKAGRGSGACIEGLARRRLKGRRAS